ncbi:hypothetical protein TRVL_08700 [Trypanosoma vivax]|nr:hypothetical protein TRVL_08700 [Trypanosoma vivax]
MFVALALRYLQFVCITLARLIVLHRWELLLGNNFLNFFGIASAFPTPTHSLRYCGQTPVGELSSIMRRFIYLKDMLAPSLLLCVHPPTLHISTWHDGLQKHMPMFQ